MPVDFFEKELVRIQNQFNQTFGVMPLCNPKVRIKVIFAIIQMGILQRKISKSKNPLFADYIDSKWNQDGYITKQELQQTCDLLKQIIAKKGILKGVSGSVLDLANGVAVWIV